MTSQPSYQGWTAKDVQQRVLEAAETLMLCPRAPGPKIFGNSMPAPIRSQGDAYAPDAPRYRRTPSAGAIDRMEECWEWINALKDGSERQLLYNWARAKIGRGRSLKLLAMEEGMSDRTLRREVTRICKKMAASLNESHTPNPVIAADDIGMESPGAQGKRKVASPNKTHWRSDNARPVIDRSQPAVRTVSR